MTRRPHGRRAGFTLIELLVVISIIVFLMGIAVGGYFRIRGSQQKSATDTTLTKCNSLIERRWKAINDQVTDDAKNNHPGYAAVLAACGSADLAKAIWTYAKMKNELPMSFNEARAAVNVNVNGSVVWAIPAKAAFAALPPGAAGGSHEESAVCLHLAVTVNAGGGTAAEVDGLTGQIGDVTVGTGNFKCFKDSWGTPIAFVRTAYNGEVGNPPFVRSGQAFDPFDPSLVDKTTNARGKLAGWSGRDAFWNSVKPNVTWANSGTLSVTLAQNTYPGRVNHTWTAISAGPNKQWGADVYGLATGDTDPGKDNQVSYRLRREGARGD